MKRFTLQEEPAEWHARCRIRGLRWLRENPVYDRPRDYWSDFEPRLREAFRGLCAFCVMLVPKADMDHFIPVAFLKRSKLDQLAYEWSNFRYVEGALNQRKYNHQVLDPFEVRDHWFKIILPSLQLVLTDRVPRRVQKKAQFTIEQLGLRDEEVVIRYRRKWFELYQKRQITLDALEQIAPLIAEAVARDLQNGIEWRNLVTNGNSPGS